MPSGWRRRRDDTLAPAGRYRRHGQISSCDALDFAEHLLIGDLPEDPAARRELTQWWRDRSGARPPSRAVRIARVARAVLVGR
ncbi:hypothetical protein [Streptomyces niveus]|uniref:hypothetical protein n=1 Tax=Streptomyces niveus TaxID=193462 RepID=UPI003F4D8682